MSLHGEIDDLIEVNPTHVGESPRLGQILEVFGSAGHEHYRVRWEDDRVTLFYPSAGSAVIRKARQDDRRRILQHEQPARR
jgi:Domain of unknown function (DUF1918)